MSALNDINILIAEDNDVTRKLMAGILQTRGYKTFEAIDGTTAVTAIRAQRIDLALVDLNMAPKGGFDLARYINANDIKIPIILVTSDDSSDLLTAANDLGIKQVLHKPIVPDRLLQSVERILYQMRIINKPSPIINEQSTTFSHEQLMQRAVDIADRNARVDSGGPFGAVIADQDGRILGEGTNDHNSRIDPTAHAEVMAICQVAKKLNKSNLKDCVLYCSSEPTMAAKAAILSVGIPKVFFGLSHEDIEKITPHVKNPEPVYEQCGKESALKMFEGWKNHLKKQDD